MQVLGVSESAIAVKRHLMCWRIFILSEKSNIAEEQWTCFAWDDDISWIKVWFHHSKFSNVTTLINSSISDVCLVVFVPNLAIQSLEFDQNSEQTWQNYFTSTMADLALISSVFVQSSKWGVKWWQSSKWSFSIYTNLRIQYLFILKEREAVIGERY